jgi:hypothetical protein
MHKRKAAEEAQIEMIKQLNNMKLLASDALNSEQRMSSRVDPLRVALKSAEHLAEVRKILFVRCDYCRKFHKNFFIS